MTFGEKLQKHRLANGMSQTALAEATGVTQSGISQYERGIGSPSWEFVQKLAAALGVTCMDLTDDEK